MEQIPKCEKKLKDCTWNYELEIEKFGYADYERGENGDLDTPQWCDQMLKESKYSRSTFIDMWTRIRTDTICAFVEGEQENENNTAQLHEIEEDVVCFQRTKIKVPAFCVFCLVEKDGSKRFT